MGQIAETLSRAKDKLVARNDKTRLVLRAGIENQQTIYRPDEHGVLELVSDQKWFQEAGLRLDPPSKGIKPVWARRRRYLQSQWVKGAPPAPNSDRLDDKAWFHGPEAERGPIPAIEDEAEDKDEAAGGILRILYEILGIM